MTLEERKKWNEKYLKAAYPDAPARIVKKFIGRAPGGRALDIGAGVGSNSLLAAEKGFQVDAVDVSDVALFRLFKRHPRINPICADLDFFEIRKKRYSLILNIRFLNRRLFPHIREGLAPGGILIFETCLAAPGETAGDQPGQDYLLRENELLHAFLSLNILFYQEKERGRKRARTYSASLVAMKRDL
ncbi:MAG: methyltransferase domain-containing protein [Desulfobacterales bacterium]|nr:methyltransferase domain-containing protein [Desulfobacterales bacterium]